MWLPELGMYYYKARIYAPKLARFMQTDPIGYEDNVNLYGYVANDPINGVDPTGMYKCGGSEAQCAEFGKAFAEVKSAASQPRTGTRIGDPRLNSVVSKLQETGDGEVTVTFNSEEGKTAGSFEHKTNTLNIDLQKTNGIADARYSGRSGARQRARRMVLGGVIAHEGLHATQSRPPTASIEKQARAIYLREIDAYTVQRNFHLQTGTISLFGSTNIQRRAYRSCVGAGYTTYGIGTRGGNAFEANCRR